MARIRATRKVEEVVIVGGLSLTFVLCLATASQFLTGAVPSAFNDALRVDGLSALVLVLCGFVGLLSASYGIGYIRRNDARGLVTPRMRARIFGADAAVCVRHAAGVGLEQSRNPVDCRRADDAGVGLSRGVSQP